MFRPTQTVPNVITAVNVAVGYALTVLLLVMAALTAADVGLPEGFRARASEHSGLLFITAVLVFSATIRPLAGGLLLLAMGVLTFPALPIAGVIALVFSLLALLRAWVSRRALRRARETPAPQD